MIRRPAVVLWLLTGLNLLNYLDRFVLAAVLPQVQGELLLSHFASGALATVFLIGYFVTSPIFGRLADVAPRGGRKVLVAVGIVVWSAATVGSGLAQGAASLFVARALVGVGEASYATIAPTLIDDLAPQGHRGRWLSIFYAAIPVGSALGYVVGGGVEHAFGWRAAFFVAGGPGLLLALLCLLVVEPARAAVDPGDRPDPLASAATLARIPLYRGAVLGYCAQTFAIGGFAFWAPAYLAARYGADAGSASKDFGMVTVLAGAIGTLLGGNFGDRAARRRMGAAPPQEAEAALVQGNLLVCAVSTAIGAPLAALAISAPSLRGFLLALFPCEVALFVIGGPVNVALLRSVPAGLRASAMALSIFAIHALGDLWSPPLIGLVADHAPMQLAMYAGPLVFALAAAVWWRASRPVDRLTSTASVR